MGYVARARTGRDGRQLMGLHDLANITPTVNPITAKLSNWKEDSVAMNGSNRLAYLFGLPKYDFLARVIERDGFGPLAHITYGSSEPAKKGEKGKGPMMIVVTVGDYRYKAIGKTYKRERI